MKKLTFLHGVLTAAAMLFGAPAMAQDAPRLCWGQPSP